MNATVTPVTVVLPNLAVNAITGPKHSYDLVDGRRPWGSSRGGLKTKLHAASETPTCGYQPPDLGWTSAGLADDDGLVAEVSDHAQPPAERFDVGAQRPCLGGVEFTALDLAHPRL